MGFRGYGKRNNNAKQTEINHVYICLGLAGRTRVESSR